MTWVVLVLAVLTGGWMLYDGLRALRVGDYTTPKNGAYAGQLGPWAGLLTRVGLNPRSTLVKALHVIAGAAWLLGAYSMLVGAEWGAAVLWSAAFLSIWYLPFGTLTASVTLAYFLFFG
jgi:hypothetical protein